MPEEVGEIVKPGDRPSWFSPSLISVIRQVLPDEACYFLMERNLPSSNRKGKSRYQILRLVRDDRMVSAYIHLGPASKFKADQFDMLGCGMTESGKPIPVHTVAELQDGANELRGRAPRRELAPSDLAGALRNMLEEKKRRKRHQSTFGSGGFIQRP